MNIRLKLKFTNIKDKGGKALVINDSNVDLILTPYYATEQEVLSVYFENPGQYAEKARLLIWQKSVEIDTIFRRNQLGVGLSEQDVFMIKHDYVLCAVLYELGKVANLFALGSLERTKQMGDVIITINQKTDPSFIKRTLDDAKECMDKITSLLEDWSKVGTGFMTFVKGEDNPNTQTGDRQWWRMLPEPRIGHASAKVKVGTKAFKIGNVTNAYISSNGY